MEWYLLKYNSESKDFDIIKKKPWEMLKYIVNAKSGKNKEYILDDEIKERSEITNKFYNGFRERLNKILGKPSKIEIDIEIMNYKHDDEINEEVYEKNIIGYYRTTFSRLLFIKILESWEMLPNEPIRKIFEEDKRHWNFELKFLFFEVFIF